MELPGGESPAGAAPCENREGGELVGSSEAGKRGWSGQQRSGTDFAVIL